MNHVFVQIETEIHMLAIIWVKTDVFVSQNNPLNIKNKKMKKQENY